MIARAARRATIGLASVAAAALIAADPAMASNAVVVAEALPSCLDHQWVGDAGVINVRTSPSRTIAWNVQDYADNGGLWVALVYVDDRQVDKKSNA